MDGTVKGPIKVILRLEGLAVFSAALMVYGRWGMGWWVFVAAFFVPDISMIGYVAGKRAGAILYNLGHAYVLPVITIMLGLWKSNSLAESLGVIWIAHIGFDRMLGYGLKYASGFGQTHLGQVGKVRRDAPT